MASVDPMNFYCMKLEFWESRDSISAMRPLAMTATIFSPWVAFCSNKVKMRFGSSYKTLMSVARDEFLISIFRS